MISRVFVYIKYFMRMIKSKGLSYRKFYSIIYIYIRLDSPINNIHIFLYILIYIYKQTYSMTSSSILLIRTLSWRKDSHGQFDYETENLKKFFSFVEEENFYSDIKIKSTCQINMSNQKKTSYSKSL